ncbi:MAG: radical SAM/Cys-rich domain protein [Thiotrichales bacterium]|jgi:radical SAM/Cys-rich protein|nr:radical SAM/Cys-rich domain protein [Thiotrichales bacterium]MBT3613276.1 radical SAM/Cys-rich domain protein [Thiotrichales bacterium]MBT3751819.1 radical SAM/Cys-rich domain protein [Thiotrichales bacterium]MBT3838050.1 radical SAM/Cys-rich domain protein [Thiotrichales bacterium]MBT4152037.1 radical SAM/Cys-rich domain protein [Thiotrichales bacterium]
MIDSYPHLKNISFPPIARDKLTTLQVNLGYRCNLSCTHCHVNAGPKRNEMMDSGTVDTLIQLLENREIKTLDLTGGAPELNIHFRRLIEAASKMGVHVIDRCNLVILEEERQEGLAQFLAKQQVEIVASMPCYLQENVDSQRGKGTFDASIRGLTLLNSLGYGVNGSGLLLNLVYNPQGAHLPPAQNLLETDYKKHLAKHYGVKFNQLLTIANLPIHRFGSLLLSKGEFDNYMDTLQEAHRTENLSTVMCRSMVSIDWQGVIYDCDFNQMLNLPIKHLAGESLQIQDLQNSTLLEQQIQVAGHCFGCTAGQGSSCGGALNETLNEALA